MKFRKEDRLAKLAFGDLNEQETQDLELLVKSDPRMEKTVLEYRSMRDGLRQLADIPEHQLSNERLRDAILGNGLNPKAPAKFDWGWIASCAVACFIVAGIVGLRGRLQQSPGEPQLMLGSSSVAMKTPLDTGRDTFGVGRQSAKVAKVAAPVHQPDASGGMLAAYDGPVRTRHHHRRSEPLTVGSDYLMASLAKQPEAEKASPTKAPQEVASQPASDVPDTSGLKPVDDSPNNSSVVVIDQDKDQDTGAQRATELRSPSNVIVGG